MVDIFYEVKTDTWYSESYIELDLILTAPTNFNITEAYGMTVGIQYNSEDK